MKQKPTLLCEIEESEWSAEREADPLELADSQMLERNDITFAVV